MSRYLVTFVSPLILLVSFLGYFYFSQYILWWLIATIIIILISARLVSKGNFFKYKLLWFNLLLVYVSQLLFLNILISDTVRYLLAFLLAFMWALIWWLIGRHFSRLGIIDHQDYLGSLKFIYYLSFWYLTTSLFSLVVFINFSMIYSCLLSLVAGIAWAYQILRYSESVNKYYIWLVSWLLVGVLAALYLLPMSFYISGTLAAVWFFFIVDRSVAETRHFKTYLTALSLAVSILLISNFLT